jgi:hypothetical protein
MNYYNEEFHLKERFPSDTKQLLEIAAILFEKNRQLKEENERLKRIIRIFAGEEE